MADSGTVTVKKEVYKGGYKVIIDWLCTAGGAVLESTLAGVLDDEDVGDKFSGIFTSFETAPGLNGDLATTLPTTLYDITITDEYGADVMAGGGANRSASVGERVAIAVPYRIDSELVLTIAAAGNAKTGRIILWFEDPPA